MQYDAPYGDWTELEHSPGFVTDPALNRRLQHGADDLVIALDDQTWIPRGEARDRWLRAREDLAVNEGKLRLASDLTARSTGVVLQPTDYAAFVATNGAAVRGRLDPGTPVAPFSASPFSNHLGGDLLAVSGDAFHLQRHRPDAAMSPGEWVASASGSFDATDLRPAQDDLVSLCSRALERELREELDPSVRLIGEVVVLGIARWSRAAGKPQVFAVCRVEDLVGRPDEHATEIRRVPFSDERKLVSALGRYTSGEEGPVSDQLRMLHALLARVLDEHPGWLLS